MRRRKIRALGAAPNQDIDGAEWSGISKGYVARAPQPVRTHKGTLLAENPAVIHRSPPANWEPILRRLVAVLIAGAAVALACEHIPTVETHSASTKSSTL